MHSDKETFEETQARLLGKRPRSRLAVVRHFKQLKWGKVLRTSVYVTFIFLIAVNGIFKEIELPLFGFILAGAVVFLMAAGISMLIQIGPLDPDDET